MIKVTVNPKNNENIYGLLTKRELVLRKQKKGTLHRYGAKKKNEQKWGHSSKAGWITLQKCLGGVLVATVQSKNPDAEWELLNSFIGFIDRNFRDKISNINLNYGSIE